MLIEKAIRILREEGIKIFFKKSFRYLQDKFQFLPYLHFFFKIKKFNSDDINESVDFVFNRLSLIKPAQNTEEISQLLQILKERKPKVILEIGTAKGGTLFLFSRIASDDATLISIDLPRGRFGGGYPIWKIPLYKSFARKDQKIYLIREDSHNQETLKKVKNILNDKKIDFLFIDGDHSYEGVREDYQMYSKLVKRGGIIAFHDIVPHPPETGCDVNRFWLEVREPMRHIEIVKNWSQGWAGIGVIFV